MNRSSQTNHIVVLCRYRYYAGNDTMLHVRMIAYVGFRMTSFGLTLILRVQEEFHNTRNTVDGTTAIKHLTRSVT